MRSSDELPLTNTVKISCAICGFKFKHILLESKNTFRVYPCPECTNKAKEDSYQSGQNAGILSRSFDRHEMGG